jgi:hypothetical protein
MEIPTIRRTHSTIVVEIVDHIVILEIGIQDEHVIPLEKIKCVF